MTEEQVVLVNEQNEFLGLMPKMEAHIKGVLHRAISVLIYNAEGEMLIQQRSSTKYHWPLIWCNACCSHPRLDEEFKIAAERRIYEELGIKIPLKEKFHFIYKAQDSVTQLIEHEYDVVFEGIYDGDVPFNTSEVASIKWVQPVDLETDIKLNPDKYSFWFKEILNRLRIEEEDVK